MIQMTQRLSKVIFNLTNGQQITFDSFGCESIEQFMLNQKNDVYFILHVPIDNRGMLIPKALVLTLEYVHENVE